VALGASQRESLENTIRGPGLLRLQVIDSLHRFLLRVRSIAQTGLATLCFLRGRPTRGDQSSVTAQFLVGPEWFDQFLFANSDTHCSGNMASV